MGTSLFLVERRQSPDRRVVCRMHLDELQNSSSTVANSPLYGQSKSRSVSHLYHARRAPVSQSMVKDKLGAVKQRPEDVCQGTPAIASGAAAIHISAHTHRFLLTRRTAERCQ